MRISDWSSDVCSSDLAPPTAPVERATDVHLDGHVVYAGFWKRVAATLIDGVIIALLGGVVGAVIGGLMGAAFGIGGALDGGGLAAVELRSDGPTSELQSLRRTSVAVFCLKKKTH